MRLQFLGDQPPHPAFLDDVARTLSLKLTCVRAMLLTKECVRVLLLLGENNTDNDDDDDAKSSRLPLKDLTDETTSPETIEICADAIETILRGSVRYELSADELRRDLERLGLPKEHTDAIAIPYGENKDKLREAMLRKVIRIGRDEGEDAAGLCSWEIVARAVDTAKKAAGEEAVAPPDLRVKVNIGGCTFSADEIDLRVCINEMKSARAAMRE